MKNIRFYQAMALALSIFTFVACADEPKSDTGEATTSETTGQTGMDNKGQPSAEDKITDSDMAAFRSTEVDPGFLAALPESYSKLLQGKWKSTTDADYTIEFSGNKMKHFHAGTLVSESVIEIDPSCEKTECKGAIGWCMIEKTGGETQCNSVLRVDMKNLQYNVLGTTGKDLAFTKVK